MTIRLPRGAAIARQTLRYRQRSGQIRHLSKLLPINYGTLRERYPNVARSTRATGKNEEDCSYSQGSKACCSIMLLAESSTVITADTPTNQ